MEFTASSSIPKIQLAWWPSGLRRVASYSLPVLCMRTAIIPELGTPTVICLLEQVTPSSNEEVNFLEVSIETIAHSIDCTHIANWQVAAGLIHSCDKEYQIQGDTMMPFAHWIWFVRLYISVRFRLHYTLQELRVLVTGSSSWTSTSLPASTCLGLTSSPSTLWFGSRVFWYNLKTITRDALYANLGNAHNSQEGYDQVAKEGTEWPKSPEMQNVWPHGHGVARHFFNNEVQEAHIGYDCHLKRWTFSKITIEE